MTLRDFVEKSRDRLRKQGRSAVPSITADFIFSAVARFPVIPQYGINIFERDWDVLLILDATRLDMYRQHINAETESIWSVGSSSDEWMRHTFINDFEKQISETAYVTGNPFSEDYCSANQLGKLNEVWRDHWDEEQGTIMPQPITDRVIEYHRSGYNRVVGHYMQPHYPFVNDSHVETGGMTWDIGSGETEELALWDQFLYGVREDYDPVKKAYDDNLRFIWDHIQQVMENVSGKVVVTADHGNALGELGMWGHKPGMLHPRMRYVPWDEYICQDKETYFPDISDSDSDFDREEQLENLGYL